MSKKLIFLMGAPTLRNLQWDEEQLLTEPIFPFKGPNIHDEEPWRLTDAYPVKWRLLQDLRTSELRQGKFDTWSQERACFLATRDLAVPGGNSANEPENSVLSRFYEHSFTVHEVSEISATGVRSDNSFQGSGTWADSTGSSIATVSDKEAPNPGILCQTSVTNLQAIPTAAYLTSIVPQTVSVNLVVSIITINPPRRIVTRQWKKELDLVEVVVGDDTRSGFGVTFWLPPADQAHAASDRNPIEDELGRSLATLRPRDIVLMRTVGLSSFRERVYGQSLRKGVTRVDLLHRQRVDATDAGGVYSTKRLQEFQRQQQQQGPAAKKEEDRLVEKVSKVREWIRRFAPDAVSGEDDKGPLTRGLAGTATRNNALPPDTQEYN
ncbi:hypothetical protein BP00DRAFT_336969 [Aspergillus indologenus CBS 114.80]|uniref:Uncharacterized protein n=1 Tax=Aspergillus indologenus CBS 114.80 TaxID=1450541 RepID=A0A2V5ICB3_9EURO|nr:hypothetical protein BP00DRAFT_336969 [Aspergillus indologenus CBS 114.80]